MDDRTVLKEPTRREDATLPAKKDRYTILVMDSGLGGFSIFAAMEAALRGRHPFGELSLIYFNAWPEQNRGYNALGGTAERVAVFDRVLAAAAGFAPDLLLIACNTLSVLYPRTAFARRSWIPVTGIIDLGVDLIHARMSADPKSRCMIFGTLTTIDADVHRSALTERGVDRRRLTAQACDQLATAIEASPHSDTVQRMIDDCVGRGADRLSPGDGPVYAALCCTHYGYSACYFQQSLAARLGAETGGIIDPNTAMVADMVNRFDGPSRREAPLRLAVVSKIRWPLEKIQAIADTVIPVSAPASEALIHYNHQPELF